MKYLCEDCGRLVELKGYSLREGALILVCPTCKQECRVPPPEVLERKPAPVLELARPKPPPAGPLCPKCGAARAEQAESCAKCGLVFALFKPENLALPGPLEELWRATEASWTEPERHAAFLAACVNANVLGEAVRRYRIRVEMIPGDAIATRFRDEAVARLMAHADLALSVREPPSSLKQRGSPAAVAVVLLCLAALVAGAFWLLRLPLPR